MVMSGKGKIKTLIACPGIFEGKHVNNKMTTILTGKKIALGKGTVAIKQMNRLISESNNSPDIFSPKSSSQKNKIGKEFIRYEQRRIKILPIRRKNDER